MTEWFEEWFNEAYLALYPHRDAGDAERLVQLLRRALPWREGWRVLDVGCGAGRHTRALEAAGARCIGLDLSATLLRRARLVTQAPLVRADMRHLPVRAASMDLTVNLFTSFGYFRTDDEHQQALDEMATTIRPGGWFVIDFLNADYVASTLVAHSTSESGGVQVDVTRRIVDEGRFVEKRIRMDEGRSWLERVRLLTATELEGMLRRASVGVELRFGDYDGSALASGGPRVILAGRRA
ncbi:MAG TPA: methyltransferase domain-containing protein [Gemmatimonadales bacterium]|nr:methyltransferase domain-containing protein [Gemmatimonadales bacterium]